MQIGISLISKFALQDNGSRLMIERARAARDAGLDSMSLGADHARPSAAVYQGVAMLGRLLAEWDPTRPAGVCSSCRCGIA